MLADTDVLVYWSHVKHKLVPDEVVERVQEKPVIQIVEKVVETVVERPVVQFVEKPSCRFLQDESPDDLFAKG